MSTIDTGIGPWLYSQGVSTVLLVLILVAIYRVITTIIPKHLDTIQQGYEHLQSSHERNVTVITSTFSREREIERQHVAATTQAIRELTEELKEQRRT